MSRNDANSAEGPCSEPALRAEAASLGREGTARPISGAVWARERVLSSIADEFGLLSAGGVACVLGLAPGEGAGRCLVQRMRVEGRLLYVRWGEVLHPGFQFDVSRGRVHEVVRPLLQLATEFGWCPDDVVLWLCSESTFFADETRPVDHFRDHELLLDVAERAWGIQW